MSGDKNIVTLEAADNAAFYIYVIKFLLKHNDNHNEIMPKSISCGNFQALAHFTEEQEPTIGWHPSFKSLSKGKP